MRCDSHTARIVRSQLLCRSTIVYIVIQYELEVGRYDIYLYT